MDLNPQDPDQWRLPEYKTQIDPALRSGRLPNGMEYYFLEQKNPEGKVFVRVIHEAGLIEEEPGEEGFIKWLKHLKELETPFPLWSDRDKSMKESPSLQQQANSYLDLLESMSFTFEFTLDKEQAWDPVFEKLIQWLTHLPLDTTRMRRAACRMKAQEWTQAAGMTVPGNEWFKHLYAASAYEEGLAGMGMPLIETPDTALLRMFFLQHICPERTKCIIVGDLVPEKLTPALVSILGSWENNQGLPYRERPYVRLEKDTIERMSTYENLSPSAYIIRTMRQRPILKQGDYRYHTQEELLASVIDARIKRMSKSVNSPFMEAAVEWVSLPGDLRCLVWQAKPWPGKENLALPALARLEQSLYHRGVTDLEWEREKKRWLKRAKSKLRDEDRRSSFEMLENLTHFASGRLPVLDPSQEYNSLRSVLEQTTVQDLWNVWSRWNLESSCVRIAPKASPAEPFLIVPREEEAIDAWIENADSLAGWIPDQAYGGCDTAGPLTLHHRLDTAGITRLKFTNGLTVYLKKTDYRKDEILLAAWKEREGPSAIPLHPMLESLAARWVHLSGPGNAGAAAWDSWKRDKNFDCEPFLNARGTGLTGWSSPEDLNYLLCTAKSFFEDPGFDPVVFRYLEVKAGRELISEPDNVQSARFQFGTFAPPYIPRSFSKNTEKTGERIPDPAEIRKGFANHFENLTDYTWLFVGNIEADVLAARIARYLATEDQVGRAEEPVHVQLPSPRTIEGRYVSHLSDGEWALLNISWEPEPGRSYFGFQNGYYALPNRIRSELTQKLTDRGYCLAAESLRVSLYPFPDYPGIQLETICDARDYETILPYIRKVLIDVSRIGFTGQDLATQKGKNIDIDEMEPDSNQKIREHFVYEIVRWENNAKHEDPVLFSSTTGRVEEGVRLWAEILFDKGNCFEFVRFFDRKKLD